MRQAWHGSPFCPSQAFPPGNGRLNGATLMEIKVVEKREPGWRVDHKMPPRSRRKCKAVGKKTVGKAAWDVCRAPKCYDSAQQVWGTVPHQHV
ncbi:hypothetical protein OS31_04080 [Dickeya oryzae]